MQAWDRYAYVNNNPLLYTDPSGNWIETAFDLISLGMTINDIRNEGFTVMNTISLVTDVASVILPIVPAGVSHAIRAAKIANKLANTADMAADTIKVVDKVTESTKALDKLRDYAKYAGDICSFSADTQVTTQQGSESISAIEVGDYVLAWNEADGTLGYYEVTATWSHADKVLTHLIINGEWIETTPEHPFYTEEAGWLPADELKPGMHVRQADGDYELVWMKWNVRKTQEMYNLTVDTAHTFFVGDGQWLVHNDCEALANTANRALQQLPEALKGTTVAASMGNNGKPILAAYNETQEGTEAVVTYLRNKKWNVLDAPVGRGPDFHAERQLADRGYTEIGISRQRGMCAACEAYFSMRPHIRIAAYRPRY